jgi:hypothetical protein
VLGHCGLLNGNRVTESGKKLSHEHQHLGDNLAPSFINDNFDATRNGGTAVGSLDPPIRGSRTRHN